jgi:hypothetical protein
MAAVLVFVLMLLQTPIVGATDAIAFDYNNNDLATFQVVRFEAAWDSQPYVTLTTVAFTDANTQLDCTSYKFIPPFTSGTHSVTVRACNSEVCGTASGPFPFAYAVAMPPPPAHLRTVPR